MTRSIAFGVVGAAVLAAIVAWGCDRVVIDSTRAYVSDGSAAVSPRPVAIVFGAGIKPDGTPSGMLADRLDGGAELLREGKVAMLLFSGDNGTVEHNELASMFAYATAHGVPRDRIVLDYAGFDTYDSCYRAVHIFGVRRAVLVTQAFHLPRALYLCRGLGMDAVGLAEPDWGRYGKNMMVHLELREAAARVRAVIDLHNGRIPEILGSPAPISLLRPGEEGVVRLR
jgi:vancomycin permeability regulator SanA